MPSSNKDILGVDSYNKNNLFPQQKNSLRAGSKQGSNYRLSQNNVKPKVPTIKVEDLDINKIIDTEKAVQRLGDIALYRLMLPQYESSSLIPYLEKLSEEMQNQNWDQVKFYAHALKGPAGYIGASKLHYACYYVQKAHIENDLETMAELYPLVVECAIELRYHLIELMSQYDGRGKFALRDLFIFRGTPRVP